MLKKLFIEYIVFEKGLSKNTISAYKQDIDEYFNTFNTFVVEENEIKRYIQDLKDRYSSATFSRKISTLKSLYKFLISNKHVDNSPFDLIDNIKQDKKLPQYLKSEEIKLLSKSFGKDYLGVRDKLIFSFLIYSGARISEVLNLNISDLDFESQTIRFIGKGDKVRFVPMSDFLISNIENYIEKFRPLFMKDIKKDLLFPKITRNNFWHKIKKYAIKSGITKEVYPHIFRHSLATIMLGNGVDIRYVQEILGHSDVSTTQIYTHISKNKLKSIYDKANHRGEYE